MSDKPLKLLDLYCGRWGWSKAFAKRGWECIGIDLVSPPDVPEGCTFVQANILDIDTDYVKQFDFICASSPCEQFSVHGMKHFHPNPPYPELGLKLFNHTRAILESAGIPYVMENVRAAQQFVGNAVHHSGPFYLWGNAVPPLLNQGIKKNIDVGSSKEIKKLPREKLAEYRKQFPWAWSGHKSKARDSLTAEVATIPLELANCVADYAERIIEQRQKVSKGGGAE